jgi:hypothetical protein
MQAASTTPALCVIDVEASGFGRGSYPIEVGYVRDDGQAWCSLIQPAVQWTHWSAEAGALHGITRGMLTQHGRSASVVAEGLNTALAGRVVYSDAWAHDYAWLATLFEEAAVAPRFKLESVVALLHPEQLPLLREAQCQALASLGLTRHRASNDARALQMALRRLQAQTLLAS